MIIAPSKHDSVYIEKNIFRMYFSTINNLHMKSIGVNYEKVNNEWELMADLPFWINTFKATLTHKEMTLISLGADKYTVANIIVRDPAILAKPDELLKVT